MLKIFILTTGLGDVYKYVKKQSDNQLTVRVSFSLSWKQSFMCSMCVFFFGGSGLKHCNIITDVGLFPTARPTSCPRTRCRMFCSTGFALDANNCETCSCKPPTDCSHLVSFFSVTSAPFLNFPLTSGRTAGLD